MNARLTDVAIVGAGPAGAALACLLAKAGIEVDVFDRARFPRTKACAEYVSPEASRVLSLLGVYDDAIDAGAVRLAGMRVRAPNGEVLTGEWAAAREFRGAHGTGLALRRERLDSLIVAAARRAGARVHEEAVVRDVTRDAGGRVASLALGDGTTRRAQLIVGADGLRSIVARRLGLGGYARWPRRVAIVTHYTDVAGPRTHGEMHVERTGYAGVAPVDSGLTNVAVVVPVAGARAIGRDPAAFLDAWLRASAPLATRFARATQVGPVLTVGPFGWRTRTAWVSGAALVGDAADFLDPFTGEGIYAALRGAELLAPFAAEACRARSAADHDAALRGYERARRAAFRGKWMVERLVAGAVGTPWVMNRVAAGLARRRDLADTLIGVTGDVVPASAVLRPGYALALARASLSGAV